MCDEFTREKSFAESFCLLVPFLFVFYASRVGKDQILGNRYSLNQQLIFFRPICQDNSISRIYDFKSQLSLVMMI